MAVRQMLVAGRYRLLEPVGAGGMGRVWLARDEMLHRDVAVKEIIPPDWMTDAVQDRLRERTLREARSAARLNHPNVVRIYDVVHADGLSWIVMEYVPSRSLHQVLHDQGPYDPAIAARIGLAVLDALDAAHQAGVLHRDIKPHNVLIGTDGRVVLTDFGLATFVDDGSVTAPGLIVGSPQYVSPERAREGASTVESDLWSLGATLYAAVEGRSPYARETAMATLAALATEPPDPPLRAGPLTPVLDGLLRYEPAARLTVPEIERRLHMIVYAGAPEAPVPGGRRDRALRSAGDAPEPDVLPVASGGSGVGVPADDAGLRRRRHAAPPGVTRRGPAAAAVRPSPRSQARPAPPQPWPVRAGEPPAVMPQPSGTSRDVPPSDRAVPPVDPAAHTGPVVPAPRSPSGAVVVGSRSPGTEAPPPEASLPAGPAAAFAPAGPPEASALTGPPEASAPTDPPEASAPTDPPEAFVPADPPDASALTDPPEAKPETESAPAGPVEARPESGSAEPEPVGGPSRAAAIGPASEETTDPIVADPAEPETTPLPPPPGQALVLATPAASTRTARRLRVRVTQARLAVTALVLLFAAGSLLTGYVAELNEPRPQVFFPSAGAPSSAVPSQLSPTPGVPLPTGMPGFSAGHGGGPAGPGPAASSSPGPGQISPGPSGAGPNSPIPSAAGSAPGPSAAGSVPGPSASVPAAVERKPFSPALCDSAPPPGLPVTPQKGAARGVNGWTLQAGWSYFTDGTGFHIAVPDGWTYQRADATYCFRSPRNTRVMSLDTGRDPGADPLAATQAEARRLADARSLPGYALVGVVPVPLLHRAADWEFRYRSATGAARHSGIRWFVLDGRGYALGWSTPEKTWAADLVKIQLIRGTFYTDRTPPAPRLGRR